MNLRTRLTVLVAAAVGCAVVLVALVAVLATRNELREGVDEALRQRAVAVADPRRGGPGLTEFGSDERDFAAGREGQRRAH